MERLVDRVDAVVVARTLGEPKTLDDGPPSERERVVAEPLLVYKGNIPGEFVVRSPGGGGASCGYDFGTAPSHLLLLVKSRAEEGAYVTGLCSAEPVQYDAATQNVSGSSPRLDEFVALLTRAAPPHAISEPDHDAGSGTSRINWLWAGVGALAGIVVIAGGTGGFLAWRHRRR